VFAGIVTPTCENVRLAAVHVCVCDAPLMYAPTPSAVASVHSDVPGFEGVVKMSVMRISHRL
jgi:hypothetical protein